jgi:hypothetical protein
MAKINKKQTSPKIASMASDLLRNSKKKAVREVAGSALSQAHNHKKTKPPKKRS